MKLKHSPHVSTILRASGICLILIAIFSYLNDFIHYKKHETLYNTLAPNIHSFKVPSASFSKLITTSCNLAALTSSVLPSSHETSKLMVQKKFTSLLEINSEVIGWITIPDTVINYPMFQHSDNQYYLSRDSHHNSSAYGSIYIDYRNNKHLNNKNTLIYGHNMNNGAMFHTLVNYKKEDFFKTHPYIYISNLYDTFTYEVFSVYVVDADYETLPIDYKDDTSFLDYISFCKSRSLFPSDINITATDQIVTLVTCSYELANARTIVHAKLIK